MRLSQIEYFLAVAKNKNITAAAKELYISQPALSKQITALEKEIGTPLMMRKSRGVELTEAGKVFEKDLKKVFRDLELAKKHAAEAGRKEKMTINLGCFEGHSINDVLHPVFEYLHEQNADIQIKLHQAVYNENVSKLLDGSLDMILIFGADKKGVDGFCYKKIIQREAAFIYSEHSSLAKKESLQTSDFEDQLFLVPQGRSNTGAFRYDLEILKQHGIENPKVQVMDNFITLMSYISMGIGYCILSRNVIDVQPDLRAYFPEKPIYMDVLAVWKEDHPVIGKLMEGYSMREIPPSL